MKTLKTDFPRRVRVIENTWIPMADGCRLAAKVWLPEDAEEDPVPALLEYIPYRKGDWTSIGDSTRHAYFAGHGYASVRVDMRGSGESDGVLLDEYLPREQEDAVEVLAWLAEQPWCTGKTGMFGISWGGFNSLQVAARRPPSLKAIITHCSTDDRYADDVHYMGGCVLAAYMLSWASTMLVINARPPDPEVVGERWRDMWLERLEGSPPFVEAWLSHQRRDAFWKQGSVCEDYARDRVRRLRRRRLGRRLPQYGLPPPRGPRLPEEGHRRSLGPPVSGGRGARPGGRVPPGVAALVGPLAQGRRHGDHGRAAPPRLDAGLRAAARALRRAAGPLDRGGELALAADRGTEQPARPRRFDDSRLRGRRASCRRLVRVRSGGRPAARSAGRGRAFALLDRRPPRGTVGDPGVPGGGADALLGQPAGARLRTPLRHRTRRKLPARHPRPAQPHPPRQPRTPHRARARRALHRPRPTQRHRPRLPAGAPPPHRRLPHLLALGLALTGAGHPHHPRRPPRAPRSITPPRRRHAPALRRPRIGRADQHRVPARAGGRPQALLRRRDGHLRADVGPGLPSRQPSPARQRARVGGRRVRRLHDRRGRPPFRPTRSTWTTSLSRGDWQIRVETSSTLSADAESFHITNTLDAYEGGTRVHAGARTLTIPRDLVS